MRSLPLVMLQVLLIGLFAEAQTPPPLLARPVTPTATVTLSDAQIKGVIVSSPTPEYPIEARRRHLTGKGVFELAVSEATGEVTSVTVVTSTGYPILDRASVKALRLWKFRPHAVSRVKLPITFTMKKSGDSNKT